MKKINRAYASEIDKKMSQFNQSHPLSDSQQEERDKYRKITQRRDDPDYEEAPVDTLWD